jgi:hypothetical protein
MHYHSNHCWCSQSNWNDEGYSARHTVDIQKHTGSTIDDIDPDWTSNVYITKEVDERRFENNKRSFAKLSKEYSDDEIRSFSLETVPNLNDEVVAWLNENVADVKRDDYGNGTMKAWAMGNQEYRQSGYSMELAIWFQRKKDAMNFIKRWSVHKKPTTYCNYFKDDRRKLIDGKLVKVDDL